MNAVTEIPSEGRELAEGAPWHIDAMAKGARCWECALAGTHRGPVPSTIPSTQPFFGVVAEAPGTLEVAEGAALIGPSGREIRQALNEAGIDSDTVAYINALSCQPEGSDLDNLLRECKKKGLPSPIDCCAPRLHNEIRNAGYLLLMGGASLKGTGVDPTGKIMKVRGTPVTVKLPATDTHSEREIPALPVPHAAFVLRENGRVFRQVFRHDVAKGVRIAYQGSTWRDPDYFVVRDAAQLGNFLFQHKEHWAVDTETDGKDPWTCRIRRVGIGDDKEVAIYSPLSVHGHWLMAAHEIEACTRAFADFFRRDVLLDFHNFFGFDSPVLERHHMPVNDAKVRDSLVGHSIGYTSELPHSLDFLASLMTDAPRWKDDVKHSNVKTDPILDKYLSFDVATTHIAAPNVQQVLGATQQDHVFSMDTHLSAIGRSMAAVGVHLDRQMQWRFASEYETKARKLLREFHEACGKEVNPRSPKQCNQFLYRELGLPILEDYRTDTGEPSTAEPCLLELMAMGVDARATKIIKALLGYREADKLLGTFIGRLEEKDGTWQLVGGPPVHADGRVRTTWKTGRATGRWSSGDPINLQNQPPKLRAMYRPAPGNVFVAADYSAIELRLIALFSGDERYIEAFDKFDRGVGPDVHSAGACESFGCTLEQVTKEVRTFQKRAVYGIGFGAEPPKIHQTLSLLRDDDLEPVFPGITLSEVERFVEKYWKVHPAILTWRKGLIRTWRRFGYLETKWHKRRRYFLAGENPTELFNFPVQGCIPHHVRILTGQGYISIGEAPAQGVVWTGVRWASYRKLNRGPAQLAQLHLANGQIFSCDVRHSVLTQDNKGYRFKHFKELKKGDRVCLSVARPQEFGSVDDLDPEEAYWLGFAIGNGSTWAKGTRQPRGRSSLTVTFGNRKKRYKKEEKAQQFTDYVRRRGYKTQKWRVEDGDISVRVEHVDWRARWEDLGYNWRWRSDTKRVPQAVWVSSLECRRQFLLGLMDADGTVGVGTDSPPAIQLCQREVLAEAQILFRTCGVESTLRGPYRPDLKRPDSVSWRLDVSAHHLQRYFSYGYPRKYAVAVRSMHAPESVLKGLRGLRHGEGRNLTASQKVLKSRALNGGVANLYTVLDIYASLGVAPPEHYASASLSKKEILMTHAPTYTLAVDDLGHRFDSEGIISKNSAADIQNDAITKVVAQVPYDLAQKMGLVVNGHDQIVIECPASEGDRVGQILKWAMERKIGPVRFPAEVKVDTDWRAVS